MAVIVMNNIRQRSETPIVIEAAFGAREQSAEPRWA
jgi:hypothetical protein